MEVKRKSSLKKKGKGLCGFLLALCMAVTATPALSMTVCAAPIDDIQEGTTVLGTGVNSATAATVYFGKDGSNNPIAWRVIGYNGTGVASAIGNMTLIAASTMGTTKFDNDATSNVYSDSDLKSAVDYIANGISGEEKAAVSTRTLTVSSYNYDNTEGIAGSEVADAVLWPLSTKEAGIMSPDLRALDSTNLNKGFHWWLRSRGENDDAAAYVYGDGSVGYGIDRVYGVRPAFYLNLDSVLFSSAAAGGKSNFSAVGTNLTNEWKLTLKDDTSTGFNATLPTEGKTGGSVTVNVTAPGSGTHNQTSAMLVDSSNKVVAYGKIGEATTGDMTFTIPATIPTGSYTLKVFQEQVNGNKETDYAGNVVENISFQITAPVTPTPIASVNNIIVTGTKGTALSDIDVSITLTDEKFKDITADTDVSGWFTNLPTGLTAKIKETVAANVTTAKVTISGIPMQASSEAMTIKIPGASLASDAELTVTTNANAKWEITEPSVPVPPVVLVGGEKLDNDKYYTVSGKNLVEVTSSSDSYIHLKGNTLTLKNFNYTAPEGNNAINITGDCNIVKEGSSEIHGGNGSRSCGIWCNGSLTFTGSGTLTAAGGEVTGEYAISSGVYAEGNITVSDGTLTGTGDRATSSYGVSAGNITVSENGTLTATAGRADVLSWGVDAREITVSENGTLTGTGGEATGKNSDSRGVSAGGNITVSDGTLTGTGGEATGENSGSQGVFAGEITVSDGTLTGTGGEAAGENSGSQGVYAAGNITVSDGTLIGTGDRAAGSSGVQAGGNITVLDGTLTGTGGEAAGEYGISQGVSAREITVSENGTLTGTGGEGVGGSFGVSAEGNITVSEGTLTGTGGEAAGENSGSRGVSTEGNITVSENGILTAAGENFALKVYGSVTISGGTLIINRGALFSEGTLTNNGTIIDNTIVPYTPTDVTVPYTPTDVTDVNAGQDPFVIFLPKTIQQIASAKEGATITIDFDDFNVLTLPVMKQMAMRRDLTIQMKYRYKGQKYEVTFPAGMPIKYQDDIRYYGPLKLADMANRDGGVCSITQ